MKISKLDLSAIFHYIDGRIYQAIERIPSEEERALAHDAIFQAVIRSQREGIPFSSSFEKGFSGLPAREEFNLVYQIVRRERGRIEAILKNSTASKQVPADRARNEFLPGMIPVLSLKLCLSA